MEYILSVNIIFAENTIFQRDTAKNFNSLLNNFPQWTKLGLTNIFGL